MDWHERITLDPEIVCGKPLVKGTAFPLNSWWNSFGQGLERGGHRRELSRLGREAVMACLEYARRRCASNGSIPWTV
jgi:uncharacterized protein (DUF433 family)